MHCYILQEKWEKSVGATLQNLTQMRLLFALFIRKLEFCFFFTWDSLFMTENIDPMWWHSSYGTSKSMLNRGDGTTAEERRTISLSGSL